MSLVACSTEGLNSPAPVDNARPTTTPMIVPVDGVISEGLVALVHRGTPPESLLIGMVCSGSLVAGKLVTAAHCLAPDQQLEAVVVRPNLCEPKFVARAELGKVIAQPRGADIAVVALAGELKIPAPHRGLRRPPSGSRELTSTGYGDYTTAGIHSCSPHSVTSNIVPWERCIRTVRTELLPATDAVGLCVESDDDNTCPGDSGGPVLDQKGQQVAVVSGGASCEEGDPAFYIRIDTISRHLEAN